MKPVPIFPDQLNGQYSTPIFLVNPDTAQVVALPKHSTVSRPTVTVFPNPVTDNLLFSTVDVQSVLIYSVATGMIIDGPRVVAGQIDVRRYPPGADFASILN